MSTPTSTTPPILPPKTYPTLSATQSSLLSTPLPPTRRNRAVLRLLRTTFVLYSALTALSLLAVWFHRNVLFPRMLKNLFARWMLWKGETERWDDLIGTLTTSITSTTPTNDTYAESATITLPEAMSRNQDRLSKLREAVAPLKSHLSTDQGQNRRLSDSLANLREWLEDQTYVELTGSVRSGLDGLQKSETRELVEAVKKEVREMKGTIVGRKNFGR